MTNSQPDLAHLYSTAVRWVAEPCGEEPDAYTRTGAKAEPSLLAEAQA